MFKSAIIASCAMVSNAMDAESWHNGRLGHGLGHGRLGHLGHRGHGHAHGHVSKSYSVSGHGHGLGHGRLGLGYRGLGYGRGGSVSVSLEKKQGAIHRSYSRSDGHAGLGYS